MITQGRRVFNNYAVAATFALIATLLFSISWYYFSVVAGSLAILFYLRGTEVFMMTPEVYENTFRVFRRRRMD